MYPALKETLNFGLTGVQKGYLTIIYEFILHKSKKKRKEKKYCFNKLLDLNKPNMIQTSQHNTAIV